MPRNYFTEEQIEKLKNNPSVLKVTKAQVVFTDEFKKKFIELLERGYGPTYALVELGIDPKILGKNRIDKLARRMREFSARPEGIQRKENSSKGKPRKKKVLTFENDTQALEYYKEYTKMLEQELEFVKKIRALEEKFSSSRAKNSK